MSLPVIRQITVSYTHLDVYKRQDEDNDLYLSLNKEMVSSEPVVSKYDVMEIKDMITAHVAYTNSEKGKEILNNFSKYLPKFKKIIPHDYKKMLQKISEMERCV